MPNNEKGKVKERVTETAKQVKTRVTEKTKQIKARAEKAKTELQDKHKRRIAKIKSLKPAPNTNTVSDNRLELLVTIVSRSKSEYYLDLIESFDVNMQFVTLGTGTADAQTLSKFGLTDSDKTVIFSVIQSNKISDALYVLDRKFKTIKNGKGIAYTIPFSSVIGKLIFGFLSDNRMTVNNEVKK